MKNKRKLLVTIFIGFTGQSEMVNSDSSPAKGLLIAEKSCENVRLELHGPSEINLQKDDVKIAPYTLTVIVRDTKEIQSVRVQYPRIIHDIDGLEPTYLGWPGGLVGVGNNKKYVWTYPPFEQVGHVPRSSPTDYQDFDFHNSELNEVKIELPVKNLLARYAYPYRFPTGSYTITDFPFRVFDEGHLLCEMEFPNGFPLKIINNKIQ